jgi:hypothetical protein
VQGPRKPTDREKERKGDRNMSKLSKQDTLNSTEKQFAEEFESLKKEFKKAGTSIKKVLGDDEAQYHDRSDALGTLEFLKDVYDSMKECAENGIPQLVTVTQSAVQELTSIRYSSLYDYYVGEELREKQRKAEKKKNKKKNRGRDESELGEDEQESEEAYEDYEDDEEREAEDREEEEDEEEEDDYEW